MSDNEIDIGDQIRLVAQGSEQKILEVIEQDLEEEGRGKNALAIEIEPFSHEEIQEFYRMEEAIAFQEPWTSKKNRSH